MALRLFLWLWSVLWTAGLPLILGYLYHRGRKDPAYTAHLAERFGRYRQSETGAVWVHVVSLGEFRGALPLIRALLRKDRHIVCTCFTPAGRREAERSLAADIAQGRASVVWVPLETAWAYRGFFRAFRPAYGLVMEVEIWPRMVFAARRAGIPLFMCNAHYPPVSLERDQRGLRLRHAVMRGFAGAMVKSTAQRARFASAGVRNIVVSGELRFDQPIPPALLAAGAVARDWIGARDRRVITIASAVEGEDEVYLQAIADLRAAHAAKGLAAPLIVYVPRSPDRFEATRRLCVAAGLTVLRRSDIFDRDLAPIGTESCPDVLLGDSLGEMFFYLEMADQVVVGGGFHPKGAHNIIEPLALKKPIITGPQTGGIEFPFREAETAGVALSVPDAAGLADALISGFAPSVAAIEAFYAENAGATDRTMDAISDLLARAKT